MVGDAHAGESGAQVRFVPGRLCPVSVLAIRRTAHRRGASLLPVLAVVGAVAFHHSGIAMGDMHDDVSLGAAVELCLAVFAVGAAAAVESSGWRYWAAGGLP